PPRLPLPTPRRVRDLVSRFPAARVLVVGDVMLDEFLIGRVTRISPEAPVPIVHYHAEEHRIGGAANVAHNVAAFEAPVDLVGIVGDDQAACTLRQALADRGIGTSGLVVDPSRPTTRKVRVVTDRRQQVARIDSEHDAEAGPEIERALGERVAALIPQAGAVVVSDYLKGAVTAGLVRAIAADARARGIPLLVDPKTPHLAYYRGATLVTPNHHEAEIATHMRIRSDEEAGAAARAFRERAGCGSVLITRGEHGMWLLDDAD